MKLESIALHHGYESEGTTKAATTPIYQTTSFTFDNTQHGADLFDLKVEGNIYTRIMNPTNAVLEQRVAEMEGGIAALALASGMSAITASIQCITRTGDNIVSTNQLYGGTYNLFAHTFPQQGINVNMVDASDFDAIEAAIDSKTKALYCESIGNPLGNVVDLEELANIAHRHNIPLIVDNTVPTPYLCKPFDFGADIVIHSLTKYIGGHGTTIGGVIVDSGKFDWTKDAKKFPMLNEPDPSYHGVVYTEALGPAAFIGRCRVVPLRNTDNKMTIKVWVGGGLGRTPIIGSVIKNELEWKHILTYCEAILRVYNLYGRRDNMYKARIKILVKSLGIEAFKKLVEDEWKYIKNGPNTINTEELNRIKKYFSEPNYKKDIKNNLQDYKSNKAFNQWLSRSTNTHKKKGYRAVTFSLKETGCAPGDASSNQMRAVSSLSDEYSFGEIRVSHEQNLILADVQEDKLYELWVKAKEHHLVTPNIGLLTDIICCPGGDFCSLANAKSIPIAQSIQDLFNDMDYLHDIGDLNVNISGCMNACGHHHVGHIGILGVDKDGSEWYQVTLGGNQGNFASIGKVIGPSFSAEQMPFIVKKIIEVYLNNREEEEIFIDCVSRIGLEPFKNYIYKDSENSK